MWFQMKIEYVINSAEQCGIGGRFMMLAARYMLPTAVW